MSRQRHPIHGEARESPDHGQTGEGFARLRRLVRALLEPARMPVCLEPHPDPAQEWERLLPQLMQREQTWVEISLATSTLRSAVGWGRLTIQKSTEIYGELDLTLQGDAREIRVIATISIKLLRRVSVFDDPQTLVIWQRCGPAICIRPSARQVRFS